MWLAHPAIIRIRSEQRVWWTPTMFSVAERWVNLWQQSGLDLERALVAAATSSTAISGAVDAETAFDDSGPPDPAALKWTPGARALYTTTRDRAAGYELLVRSVVDGLYARLSREAEEETGAGRRARRAAP
jgi:hypothetical protein